MSAIKLLVPGIEPGSRANLALAGDKSAALPIKLQERKSLVGPVRLELTSHGLKGRCLIQLGHRPELANNLVVLLPIGSRYLL